LFPSVVEPYDSIPVPRRRERYQRLAALAALAGPCLLLAACAGSSAPHGPPPISVTSTHIERGTIATYVSFDGQITPLYQTTLSTAEAGTVASVDVTEGDFVRQGQRLASLDTSQLAAQLAANQALVRGDAAQLVRSGVAAPVNSQQYTSAIGAAQQNLQAANNAVATARSALVSDTLTKSADASLLAQGYVSTSTFEIADAAYVSAQQTLRSTVQAVPAAKSELQTALTNAQQRTSDQATIAQSRAALDAARANVELLQAQIAQSSIVAPFDGQITQRLLDPGAFAGASTAIFEIAQVASVYVVASVPDVDLAYAVRGKAMTFTTPSLPGRTFRGRVFDVNITPTSGTLTYRVRLLEPNPDLALRGGMLVDVTTESARHTGALLVPPGAIVRGPTGTVVYTVVRGKAKSVPVRVGLRDDRFAEVYGAGLSPATTVITAQADGLRDGATVVGPGIVAASPAAAAHS
jgi:RND family efflux transporter MFP subunit